MKTKVLSLMAFAIIVPMGLFARIEQNQFEPTASPMCQAGFDTLNIRFIENWPFGPCYAVVYDNARQLVFSAAAGGVYILDVSDPSNPQKVSKTIHTRGVVYGLCYEPTAQRLYIAAGQGDGTLGTEVDTMTFTGIIKK